VVVPVIVTALHLAVMDSRQINWALVKNALDSLVSLTTDTALSIQSRRDVVKNIFGSDSFFIDILRVLNSSHVKQISESLKALKKVIGQHKDDFRSSCS
jgi:hypothetical protein